MTTLKDGLMEEVAGIRRELERLLAGMEYCLDWKPEEGEWSVREVVYHIVDTPEGGIHDAVQRTLDGALPEITVNGNLSNMTDQRLGKDLEAVKADIEAVLSGMERALVAGGRRRPVGPGDVGPLHHAGRQRDPQRPEPVPAAVRRPLEGAPGPDRRPEGRPGHYLTCPRHSSSRSSALLANTHMFPSRSESPVSTVMTRSTGPTTAMQACPAESP